MNAQENPNSTIAGAVDKIADAIVEEMSKLRVEAGKARGGTDGSEVDLINKQVQVLEHYLFCAVAARAQATALRRFSLIPRR